MQTEDRELIRFFRYIAKGEMIMRVDKYVKGAVRQFAYWFAHGTIGSGLLNGIDYVSDLQEESSFAEQAFVVFMNNLEYDETGVTNYK